MTNIKSEIRGALVRAYCQLHNSFKEMDGELLEAMVPEVEALITKREINNTVSNDLVIMYGQKKGKTFWVVTHGGVKYRLLFVGNTKAEAQAFVDGYNETIDWLQNTSNEWPTILDTRTRLQAEYEKELEEYQKSLGYMEESLQYANETNMILHDENNKLSEEVRKLNIMVNEDNPTITAVNNYITKLNEEKQQLKEKLKNSIRLNKYELQSGLDRVKNAESLIEQLPLTHGGRNTWLLNYGRGSVAKAKRSLKNIKWDNYTQSAELATNEKKS